MLDTKIVKSWHNVIVVEGTALIENSSLRLTVCYSHIGRSLMLHGKNDFTERSKILLDTDDTENNFVGPSK